MIGTRELEPYIVEHVFQFRPMGRPEARVQYDHELVNWGAEGAGVAGV
jgi:hypothetical protein